ncbi:putative ribonuclease H-like domain-containing protein [Tanacetum coccineum]
MYRSQTPRGNQRNWNNQKSQQLGSDFVMHNKACFICGSFDHVQANCNYHQRERVVSGSNYTRVNYNYSAKKVHSSAHRSIVPRAVLMKTSLRLLNIARPVNIVHPKTTVYNGRPTSCFFLNQHNQLPRAVNIARPNSIVVNAFRANQTSRNLMEDMLPLGEELREAKLLMYDKKNSVLFTNTACFVLSPNFKLPDESQVLLKVPRKNNMYSVDMKNIVPRESLTCLVERPHLMNQCYGTIENLVDKKVKIIRCDNGTEFKNRVMSEFYEKKGIKREFSVARTPQQNGVAERRNRTLIEAARTMLADSKLPTIFWAEVVNTACYVHNKVKLTGDQQLDDPTTFLVILERRKMESGIVIKRGLINSEQAVNTARPNINTASINTGSLNINTASPTVTTALLEATHADFFGVETELDMSNITTTYPVPSTLNT